MGKIWVREFLGGLDRRRMAETTSGGILIEAVNGHITRGGEFEKRAAFVKRNDLPLGTVGLAYDRTGLVVFGSGAAPTLPVGVRYQRLQHPDGATLIGVSAFDLFGGKIYAVGVFADGTTHHFYDGTRVADWNDGRARATISVTAGSEVQALAAQATLKVTAGTLGIGNELTSLKANSVDIIDAPVPFGASFTDTAIAIAQAINDHVSSPNYTAVVDGEDVVVTAVIVGTSANGYALTAVTSGDAQVETSAFAGGRNFSISTLQDIKVDGVSIIGSPVTWAGSLEATAAAIAEEITSHLSTPEYTAIANGNNFIVRAATAGVAGNGKAVVATVSNGLVVSPNPATTSGGVDPGATFVPESFARTISAKMYVTSSQNLHFSAIKDPTKWTTENTGAGFIDMSMEASGSEQLTAVAKYQNLVAVFSAENVLVWYMDPDPNLNKISQVLNNTGTSSARSVTQFGDDDIFYLDTSGIRSLRARDASNAASTTDIGSAIDPIVAPLARGLTSEERARVFGGIEPTEGRFWMAVRDTIFVFSYFSGAKVSAWTMYKTGFNIDEMVVWNRRVYLRSGNAIYVYGGEGADPVYDETEALARLPYLDADNPTMKKTLSGHDAAAEGLWEVSVSMDPNFPDVSEVLGNIFDTSYVSERLPAQGASTHFSMTYRSKGSGPAKLGAIVIHYDAEAEDD